MMSLFDEEEVIKSYIKSERYEAEQDKEKKTAIRMIKAGKMSLEDIADYTGGTGVFSNEVGLIYFIGNRISDIAVKYFHYSLYGKPPTNGRYFAG